MSPFTLLILIAFGVGTFGFIDEETELDFADELISSEDHLDLIGESEGKIVGGSIARAGEFPHQVSIQQTATGNHFCGGSILNRRFILTAAHCTQYRNSIPDNIRVVVGALRRIDDGIVHQVDSIHPHPQYVGLNLTNDIALLRTVNNILFNTSFVRSVRLPISNVPEAGNFAVYISGWGQTDHPSQPPNRLPENLHFKDALTLNREECIARLGINGRNVHENTICVQNPVGRGICVGDAGGPLITERRVQVGVASWQIPCGRGVPDVYSNVFSHIEWIRASIRANMNSRA